MKKHFHTMLSGLAILIGLISISLSLTSQGPAGEDGSQGAIGSQGPSGNPGQPGEDGSTPYIGLNGNWWIGDTDSGVSASGSTASEIPLPNIDLSLSIREIELYNEQLSIPFSTPEESSTYAQNLIDNQGFIGISTAAELMNMQDKNGKYVLLNDITFPINLGWSPINFNGTGSFENYFSGTLDGAGFFINDLHYESIDFNQSFTNFGLFEGLFQATIRHVYLRNFNIYALNNQNRSQEYVGSLAGKAFESTIYNVNMLNTFVSGQSTVGGLIGLVYDSSIRFVTANLNRVWGTNNLGGLFGNISFSEITNINIKTQLNGSQSQHGGLSGYSNDSYYAWINVEIETASTNTSDENYRYDIGGVSGSASRDRLFRVTTTGVMEFVAIETNYTLINVGGVIGYGNNVVLGYVENRADIYAYMANQDFLVSIQSIGGIIGSVDFGTFHYALNSGDVIVYPPAGENFNFDYYVYEDETPVEYVGGLIGYVYGSINMKYVVNTGSVGGIVEVGGIIGSTGISYSYLQQLIVVDQAANFGSVGGISMVGGLMGISDVRTNFIVANFMNHGNVEALFIAGGFFGVVSPVLGIKVQIINSYNRGVVTARDYGVGGLIGGVVPETFNFVYPVLGEVHIYNSFNVGLVQALNLGKSNVNFDEFSGGSIIGIRFMLVYMYGVSYTSQITEFAQQEYDQNTLSYVETGRTISILLPGVGNGNNTDMMAIANPQFLFNQNQFIYRTAWDFTNIWASDVNELDGLPYLQFLESLLGN